MTIPASVFSAINPGVIGAGGNSLVLNGLILSALTAVPLGTVQPFANALAVSNFFGPATVEAAMASTYFNGFDNSTQKPGNLLFAQYNAANVAAYLRGGSLAAMTLAQLQAIPAGTMTVTVDGVAKTTASVNLSGAASFSAAAALISTGFTGGPVVAYDSQRQALTFTSGTTGASSTISFGSGALSTALNLTSALGAVTSQGAVAATPAAAMTAIAALTQNWAAFTSTFEPNLTDKTAFGTWTAAQGNRYAYVAWDNDANAIVVGGGGTAFGTLNLAGCVSVYADKLHAAFVLGFAASLDFTRLNGRATLAYKSQSGLVASVTDATIAATLKANGYNYYGAVATANANFTFMFPGQIGGAFSYLDEYLNEIWLSNAFQLAFLTLLTNVPSIPYNVPGYALVESAAMDPINAALNFGAIRAGVPLSASQKAQVNAAAGVQIDTTLAARGWYLQILPASALIRGLRQSPPCSFWYMDGGSIHQINLASVVVQ